MARKRDVIQIQTEVTTQEEWEQEIARPGLTVVDVYPDWCGPCSSMVGTLKKIKFELGDDMLNYVTARSDDIAALESYRNRSEPLWIFFGSGHPVYQLRGAHSPLLAKKIVDELEKEKKAMAGEAERATIPLVCDAPAAVQLPPQAAAAAAAAAEDEAETAESLNARRQRSELRVRRALAPYGLLVIGPAAADRRDEILSLLEPRGFTIGAETLKTLTEEQVDALLSPPPPPPPSPPAAGETAEETTPSAAEGDDSGPAPAAEGEAGGATDAAPAREAEEDPEAVARRQAAREQLLEGECALLALKDSEFSLEKPYRWLTLYLGRTPAPPPEIGSQAEVSPPVAGGQQGSVEEPAAGEEAPPDGPPEPEPAADGAGEPEPEPEPALSAQLRDLLGEAAAAVFSPETVLGQWAALRLHFPELYRAPEPTPAAGEPPPPDRQVAFAVFAGDREQAAEQLTEAGFTVLHSGVHQLTDEVAGQLVARLEGGESQLPELVAAPVLAAAVASEGGAALSVIANLDPLYLSDNPDQADRDARLVFSSWGVEIPPLQSAGGGGGGAEAAVEGGTGGAPGPAATEDTPVEGVPAEAAPVGDAPAAEEAAGGE